MLELGCQISRLGVGNMKNNESSLEKGLSLLELVNSQATISLADLHARTGLSKPTIIRLLKALEARGYVTKISRKLGYRVGSRALSLSSGFHGAPKIAEIAAPFLDALTTEILWPASLATLDLDAMVVRYSTIPLSPLSHKHSTLNNRLELGCRAHGRAYLCYCSERERQALFQLIEPADYEYLERHRERFCQQGWTDRDPELAPRSNSIAAPIKGKTSGVVATVCITYFRSVVGGAEQKHLAQAVLETTDKISRAYHSDQNQLARTKETEVFSV